MKFSRNNQALDQSVSPVHQLETLEPRKLLTTLVGGDVFQFIDANHQLVRVIVQGDAMVELIGAGVSAGGTLYLDHLPGRFIQSDLGLAGRNVQATDSPIPINELFSIYVSQSSANASIAISVYRIYGDKAEEGATEYYLPFSGTEFNPDATEPEDMYTLVDTDHEQYNLYVSFGTGASGKFITFPAGIGGAYIGARAYVDHDDNPQTPPMPMDPIISGALGRLGMLAAGVDQLVNSSADNISAGVEVAPSLLDYVRTGISFDQYLIGGSLNRGQGLTVDSNGVIVTVDTDRRGSANGGDYLSFIGSDGAFVREIPITVAGSGLSINTLQAVGFSNLYFGDSEQLWAVATIRDPRPVDRSDEGVGGDLGDDYDVVDSAVDPDGDLHVVHNTNDPSPIDRSGDGIGGDLLGDYDIVDIAVNSSGIMYAIHNNGGNQRLMRINRDANGGVTSVTDIGRLVFPDPGFSNLTTVEQLEIDPISGTVYVIATNLGGTKSLFSVALTPIEIGNDALVDELVATPLVTLAGGTTDAFTGMAFKVDPTTHLQTLYVLREQAAGPTLNSVNISNGILTALGVVQVDDTRPTDRTGLGIGGSLLDNYEIVDIAISPIGDMYAVHDTNDPLPIDQSGQGIGGDLLNDYNIVDVAVNSSGDMYAVYNVNDPRPFDQSMYGVGGDLLDNYDIVDIAVDSNGIMYAIHNATGGEQRLIRINRNADGGIVSVVDVGGRLVVPTVPGPGFINLVTVEQLEVNPVSGVMYVIAANPQNGNKALFSVDLTPVDADADDVVDELVATLVSTLGSNVGGVLTPTTEAFTGMTFHDNNLYVLRQSVVGITTLATVNIGTGEMTPVGTVTGPGVIVGVVRVNGQDVVAAGMGFDANGVLHLLDRSAGTGRIVVVNLDNANESTALTGPNKVDPLLVGYGSDQNGTYYGVKNNGGSNDVLFVGTAQRLLKINRNADGGVVSITELGRIVRSDQDNPFGFSNQIYIEQLEFDPIDGVLYAVATNLTGTKSLFSVVQSPVEINHDALNDEIIATQLSTLAGGTTNVFTGMAFKVDPITQLQTLYVLREQGGSPTLNSVNVGTGSLTNLGVVQVDDTRPTDRTGLGVGGDLLTDYGIIDLAITAAGQMYAVNTTDSLVVNRSGEGIGGNLLGNYDIVDIAVNSTGIMYAVHNAGGQQRLMRINRNAAGGVVSVTDLGRIVRSDPNDPFGFSNQIVIEQLEFNPTSGVMYAIATNLAGTKSLFSVVQSPIEINNDTAHDEIIATELVSLAGGTTNAFTGMAFGRDPVTQALNLYVLREAAGISTLNTVNIENGDLTQIGLVQVGGVNVAGAGMGFDADGLLRLLDRSASAGTGRIVTVDLIDPLLSVALTTPNSVDALVQAYGADQNGVFFGVQDNAGANDILLAGGAQNLLQINRNVNGGVISVNNLGHLSLSGSINLNTIEQVEVDPISGVMYVIATNQGGTSKALFTINIATRAATLLFNLGGGTTNAFTGMAFRVDPVTQALTLYVLRETVGGPTLATVNMATGALTNLGVVQVEGVNVVSFGMGFNADGILQLLDRSAPAGSGRIVTVDLVNPNLSVAASASNTIDPLVQSYAAHLSSSTFYGVQNNIGIADVLFASGDLDVASAGMGFDADGVLHLLDRSAPAGTGRIITVDLADPSESVALTAPDAVNALVESYASDRGGIYYGVQDNIDANNVLFVSDRVQNLILINRDANDGVVSVTDLGGPLVYAGSGSVNINSIEQVEVNPISGVMYAIATNLAGTSKALFSIDTATQTATLLFNLGGGTTDAFTGMAFRVDPVTQALTLYVLRETAGGPTLATVNLNTGALTNLGVVQVGGVNVVSAGMGFNANGVLQLLDRSAPAGTGRIVTVDLVNPALSVAASASNTINSLVQAYASDLSNSTYYGVQNNVSTNDVLFVSGNLNVVSAGMGFDTDGVLHLLDRSVPAGTGRIVTVDLIDPTESVALTAPDAVNALVEGYASDPNGMYYGVQDNVGANNVLFVSDRVQNLILVNRDANGGVESITDVGRLVLPGPGFSNFNTIEQIEVDPISGIMYAIASNLDGTSKALFSINTSTRIATPLFNLGGGTTDAFTGMAFRVDPTTSVKTLYVLHEAVGGPTLATVNLNTGVMTNRGVVQVGGVNVVSAGMGFDDDGLLQLLDRSAPAGTGRIVTVNLNNPSQSVATSGTNTVNSLVVSYTADGNGDFLGIQDNVGSNDMLFVSTPAALALGTINTTTGEFTLMSDLVGVNSINSMAFAPFASTNNPTPQQALYLLTSDNQLLEVDPLTGEIFTTDQIVTSGSDPLELGSIAFGPTGQIYVHDLYSGSLFDINLQDQGSGVVVAGGTVQTAAGTLRPTVAGLAFDGTTGRMLAIDNAPAIYFDGSNPYTSAALMSLRGLSNNTDTHQDLLRLRIGGRITGSVTTSGSLDQFYAGAVLTGNAQGQHGGTTPDISGNFYIAGDLREMIVASSIGTHTTPAQGYTDGFDGMYVTGFDMVVRGKIGYIRVNDSFIGSLDVGNLDSAPSRTVADAPIYELEANPYHPLIPDNLIESEYFIANSSLFFRQEGVYFNDTFDTAQRLGSLRTGVANQPDIIRVNGLFNEVILKHDIADYYSVFLEAGQVVTVTLDTGNSYSPLRVGIFDPDHRLIDTDESMLGSTAVVGQPFSFRADRPGEYRFVVGKLYDPLFDGNSAIPPVGPTNYTLIIEGAGDLALGALGAGRHILIMEPGDTPAPENLTTPGGIRAIHGDIGGIVSVGRQMYFNVNLADVAVNDGNLRGMVGQSLATTLTGAYAFWPILAVPRGNVGLLKATGDMLYFTTSTSIGGNLQTVDAAQQFGGVFAVNGGIGVIRAGRATLSGNMWSVNADGVGADGIIDLIDIEGDLGTINNGGPAITTGPGGNVRYMRVGGDIYQDSMYGGGTPTEITLAAGQSHVHVDDGGGRIVLAPRTSVGALTITRYGIRGSGGSVLVDVTSSDSGVLVTSTSAGPAGSVEIGQITANGTGREVIDAAGNRLTWNTAGTNDLNVIITGALPVDVFQITGGNLSRVQNLTGGEIVGVNASTIIQLYSTGTLGLARSSTGAIVNPRSVIANNYPFVDQRYGIVSGNIWYIGAEKGLGNVFVTGNIDQLMVNPGGVRGANEFRGILAPVYATGNIYLANLGEGIAPTRRGGVSQAGLYAGGKIDYVRGQAAGTIIHGDIIASGGIGSISLVNGTISNATIATFTSLAMAQPQYPTGFLASDDIGSIYLSGRGGIIGSSIFASNVGNIGVMDGGFGIFNSYIGTVGSGTIGNITADGYGISNLIVHGGSSAGDIRTLGRGQMLQSTRYVPTVRLSENFTIDPLFYERVNVLNDLNMALQTGTAQLLPENVQVGDRFTITVSDGAGSSASVSYVATAADPLNVINGLIAAWAAASVNPLIGSINASAPVGSYLQLQARVPQAAFVITTSTVNGGDANTQTLKVLSNRMAGVIDQLDASGSNALGSVVAYRISNSAISYANRISGIYTAASIDWNPFTVDNLSVVTGAISAVQVLGGARNFPSPIAGIVHSFAVYGDFGDQNLAGEYSYINANGPSGVIINLYVGGNLYGDIRASSKVGSMKVGGNMEGNLFIDGANVPTNGNALGTLRLNGNLVGSINVMGNVDSIVSAGSLGVPGDELRINGNLGSLYVGTDTTRNGIVLATDVIVQGDLGLLDVRGAIEGDVFVGGDLGTLNLRADTASLNTAILDSNLIVGRDLRTATITNGHIGDGVNNRQITIGRNIGTLALVNGSINDNAVVTSLLGSINSLVVRNGSIYGDIVADTGSITSLYVVGSDLGGNIQADSAGTISFVGSMLTGASININNAASVLSFGQNVQAGTTINLGALDRMTIGGNLAGTFNIGYNASGTTVTIGGNLVLTPGNAIDANTRLTVGGSMSKASNDARLYIGRNLVQLAVVGGMSGDVIVQGAATAISAASLSNSVITTGLDLTALTIAGAMNNSLVQSGLRPGNDTQFAATLDARDLGEESQQGGMGTVRVGSMTNSIIAAGAGINVFVSGDMTRSSASAGLSLGSLAVRQVLNDATRLADVTELNAARQGADLVLMRGDVTAAAVTGAGLIDSYLTAGVGPGAAGDFATPSVVDSVTGGTSRVVAVRGILGAGSRVVADAPIITNNLTVSGGTVNDNVTYTIANITTDLGAPLQNLLGTATAAAPLVVTTGLGTFRIVMAGPGSVMVYDNDPTDGVIDAVRFSGTSSSTAVAITGGGAYDIARMLSDDDSTVGRLVFDGDLVGEGTAAPDLWIDGPVGVFTIQDLGNNVNGQIGGNVGTMTMVTQGSGLVMIGGSITALNIQNASQSPMIANLGTYANYAFNTVSVDASGQTWAHAGGVLYRLDPTVSSPGGIASNVSLTDGFTGQSLTTLLGMDYAGAVLGGVARLYDPNPTQTIGTIHSSSVTLRGLAVNSSGQAFAIDSASGFDQLVQINPTTGARTVIGTLYNSIGGGSYVQNVLALSFDSSNRLVALVSDRDGNGPFDTPASGVALVQIQTTANDGKVNVTRINNNFQKGVFLNSGGVTDNFTALAVRANGEIYAIRRTGGTQDDLVRINATTGAITLMGQVQVSGQGTNIVGMGFDENGNLVALDNDGVSARLIFLRSNQLATPDQAQDLTATAPLSTSLDTFALGRSGTHYRAFAYDTAGNGTFYANPVDAADAQGRVLVLGTIDTATGVFTRSSTLVGALGSALSLPAARTNMPLTVDNTQVNAVGYLIDGSNRLISLDLTTMQTTVIGTITEIASGQTLSLGALEFDETSGQLIGVDTVQGRSFVINTATAVATQRSEAGAVGSGLIDLAYDVQNNQLIGYVVNAANQATNHFVQFKDADAVGGIVAASVTTLQIGSGSYYGRVVATGNTFGTVVLSGDFYGSLSTAGNINRFVQTAGVFAGNLKVAGDVNTLWLANEVQSTANIQIDGRLVSFTQNSGAFAGRLEAATADTIVIVGDLSSTGVVETAGRLVAMRVGGNLSGTIHVGGSTDAIRIVGVTTATGSLQVDCSAGTLVQWGGVDAGSTTLVLGSMTSYWAGGTFRGQLFVRKGISDTANFVNVNTGLIAVGLDTNVVSITGSVIDSLFSLGTWVGDDAVFNTADDLLTGGSVNRFGVAGNFTDSVVAAGVLPDLSYGPGRPTDNRAYRPDTLNGTLLDDAQAGGLLRSYIHVLVIRGQVFTTQPNGARQSVAAAADGILATYLPAATGAALTQATYRDPIGAPTVYDQAVEVINQSTVRVYFSEPINTATLSLAQTVSGPGGVLLQLDNVVITDAQLVYSTRTLADGTVQGVLTISRTGGFNGNLQITLRGTGATPILDRSGLRSMLRVVGDPLQTKFDGANNDQEGSDFVYGIIVGDVANTFQAAQASSPIALSLDAAPISLTQSINSSQDMDVYRLNGTAGQLLSVRVSVPAFAAQTPLAMAIFYRDTQGNANPADDLYKVLARYESNHNSVDFVNDEALFQAVELPENTEYYVVVGSAFGLAPVGNGAYSLQLALASDEANLVSQFNATSMGNGTIEFADHSQRQIGYITNGLRNSKQLVYLNFDGGVSTLTSEGFVVFSPLEPSVLAAQLAGQRDALINGGAGVTGIVQNILDIYNTLPGGSNITAQYLDVSNPADWATYQAATTGLYFTTANPVTAQGLDQYADFTTVFIGQSIYGGDGLYGVASTIGMAGMTSGNEALVFAQNFADRAYETTTTDLLNAYSLALANTAAHELGHTLGLNHQPTNWDPEDCLLLPGGANAGEPGLMTYTPSFIKFSQLELLGLNVLAPYEFSVPRTLIVANNTAMIDTAELIYWWFA